jgi:hypothetical protein
MMLLIAAGNAAAVTVSASPAPGAASTAASTAAGAASTSAAWFQTVHMPSSWPSQMDLLQWSQQMGPGMATVLILLGIIYLMFGFYLFKGLVVMNAACVGAWFGAMIGDRSGSAMPCAVLGAFVAAAVTIPTMKWAVAVLGGLLGAGLGGSIWRLFDLDPHFAWAGAGMGLIACGLFCFILFRGSVMAYMSMQGSIMLVFGVLGLLYKYQNLGPKITSGLQARTFILPMAVFIPTVIGLLYQQSSSKEAAAPAKK